MTSAMSRAPRPIRAATGRTARRVLLAFGLGLALVAASWLVGSSDGSSGAPPAEQASAAVVVSDGSVVGDVQTLEVQRGQRVTLEVTADVVDEVHVHGYDIIAPTNAQQPVVVMFDATIPGQFDVELEALHLRLVSIRVR